MTRDEDAMEGSDGAIYHARLHPRRSLTPRQARRVIAGVAAFTSLASIPFYVMGAWPVVGFLGLDVVALGAAFAASFRAARAYEDVTVTPLELAFAKVNPRGLRREWRFNPLWVRLLRRDHEEFGLLRLAFAFRNREVEVASFLGPGERALVASDLARALAEARRGPRFDNSF
jgi:uncharacterized membrane protein